MKPCPSRLRLLASDVVSIHSPGMNATVIELQADAGEALVENVRSKISFRYIRQVNLARILRANMRMRRYSNSLECSSLDQRTKTVVWTD